MTNPVPGVDFPFTLWKISNLERHLDSIGTVYTAHYTITHFRDGEQAGAYGSLGFEAPDPESAIPYAELDEATVVGWCQDALGEEKVTEIIAALNAQIDEKLAPTKATGMPWA